MLQPRSGAAQQVIHEVCQLEPKTPIADYIDSYGNLCQRLLAPKGQLRIKSTVTVDTADHIDVHSGAAFVPVQDLPDHALQFLLPSRYAQADLLGELASQIVTDLAPGYDQVEAIRHWIHSHIEYRYDTSNASTSAVETEKTRVGVCRDFVHLGLALCRSMTIPARMVVGYLYQLDPMDLHAWFEAFVGDRWYTFDPTQTTPRGNRIAIAYGRDAADVALATQFGPIDLTEMNVWVEPAR
ncbi:MAG: transglutaminase family protein [Nodosilinea sp.]